MSPSSCVSLRHRKGSVYSVLFALALSFGAPVAFAQGDAVPAAAVEAAAEVEAVAEAGAVEAGAAAAEVPSETAGKGLRSFEQVERLEKLRYRHLWIAYSFIWALIFIFVWRTYRRVDESDRVIESLKAQIDQLEKAHSERAE